MSSSMVWEVVESFSPSGRQFSGRPHKQFSGSNHGRFNTASTFSTSSSQSRPVKDGQYLRSLGQSPKLSKGLRPKQRTQIGDTLLQIGDCACPRSERLSKILFQHWAARLNCFLGHRSHYPKKCRHLNILVIDIAIVAVAKRADRLRRYSWSEAGHWGAAL